MDVKWLEKAIKAIKSGLADKLFKDDITVYKVGSNLIRVDIKTKISEE